MMTAPHVAAYNLKKSFYVDRVRKGFLQNLRGLVSRDAREVKAIDDISFEVAPGSFVAYVGPNGAGKSTTIKVLSGILHPTSGQAWVAGLSPQEQRRNVARRIGVVFGQRTQLWWDLPVRDSLEILAAMYDIGPADYRHSLNLFDDLLEIGRFIETPVRKLSLGQRMRADLAAALLHRPEVLFLDEPTIGLDVTGKAAIREFLRDMNKQAGTTILLTTHDMTDIEQLCHRVLMINHGRLVFDGSLSQLRGALGLPTRLTVEYAAAPGAFPREGVGWYLEAHEGTTATVTFDRAAYPAGRVIADLSTYGEIRDVHIAEPDIETVIARSYQALGASETV